MRPRIFRRDGDHVRATFEALDIELLEHTRDQLRQLLARDDPSDPVVRRLFPTAVLGDAEADGELRDLFHDELTQRRLDGLEELTEILARGQPHGGKLVVDLVDDEPLLMLGVLNDVRLAIGASIDIDRLDRDAAVTDDALAYRLAVMDHFAGFQDELLAIIDPVSRTYVEGAETEDLS